MLFEILAVATAFFVGFAMKRGGLCTYAAVLQLVHQRRFERLVLFLGVAAWATAVLLPLHRFWEETFALSPTHGAYMNTLVFGTILGVGAFLNRGCFFGTFVALVGGNLNYLATLLGLVVGVGASYLYSGNLIQNGPILSPVAQESIQGFVWWTVALLFALFLAALVHLGRMRSLKSAMGLARVHAARHILIVVIGVGGAVLYGAVEGWSYSGVLHDATLKWLDESRAGVRKEAFYTMSGMVAGGIVAAIAAKSFKWVTLRPRLFFENFLGGTLMGSASFFLPGGNDALLLQGIPSLAPHAFTGYAAMLVSMWFLVKSFRPNHDL
ncbi:YeeE/YedE thiosulfate transporter family protein [Hydrogenimonas sp.]